MNTPALQRSLGYSIRIARVSRGLTQEEFATQLGMHRTALGHIEQGRKDCRLSTLVRIAEALKVQLSQLVQMSSF